MGSSPVVGHHKLSDFLFRPTLLAVHSSKRRNWEDGHSFRLFLLFLDEGEAPSEGRSDEFFGSPGIQGIEAYGYMWERVPASTIPRA